ncbi:unnamed protein product [Pocillopora meandrina]|uniref:Macrophage mannose receptor 1-like n=1 Tax=Pocillopora meandrina TaxID=46732 RepID=A0AAU9WVY0_9CNID|nr:unnamed protein product [Pocillopora meandrina]
MNFIYSHSSKNWRENYWIGLNDQHNESQFVWSDGTPFNSSVYNNWNSGEPNDGGGVEDCVELYLRRWNDDKCNSELGYICERPKGVPMPTSLTVSPPATSTPISCPIGWEYYGSSCYKFSSVRKTWTDAAKDCRALGGYLVKIDDSDEQHFITFKQRSSHRTRWIGLSDSAVEGNYRWEGDNTLVNYTYWATDEPNDFAGSEDCVQVWAYSSGGLWNDDFCNSEHYYICEKPGGQNLCPLNWRGFGDYCYQFNIHGAHAKSWLDAEKACMSHNSGTELVSISAGAEQDFLFKYLKDMRIPQIWIGLNDRKQEGTYVWTDKSSLTYKNWAPKQPSNGFFGTYADCARMDADNQNGTWSMAMCRNKFGYVCKRKNGINQCDSPFGMEDESIADSQISTSSNYNFSSRASQARLRLESGDLNAGAWCAAQSKVGEYLHIDLGVVRQVRHIALQGRPGSSDYVKTFYLRYGNNGLDFNNYGENATVKYKTLGGNVNDAASVSNIALTEPIYARFIRIYPLSWNSRICLRTEIYGCASQASSKKCGIGWEIGPDETCYQINSNQWKLWADARASCLSRGGDLVSIVTMKEKNWLNNRLQAVSGWTYSFWLGLNDRDSPKHFYWSDGSPYRLTAWDAGYPTNTPQTPKACVEIDTVRGAWRDVSCGEYRPFICKRKMGEFNGVKTPVTGNWISGTDYYWPLDQIVDGKSVVGTVPAIVHGEVKSSNSSQNGRSVVYFRGYQAHLDAERFQDPCISNLDKCENGISVSFVIQFEDDAKTWKTNTFIVYTFEDVLQKGRGFALYYVNGQLHTAVNTRQKRWHVFKPLQTGKNVWHHVMFTWQREKGIVLYINGKKSSSLYYGVSSSHSKSSSSFIVGSKSTQPLSGGFRMRSLAVWRRPLTSQEVNRIYLAEFGSCRVGWKDFGQYCYQFNLNKKSWPSAQISCVNQQAELVSIHSPVEQAHISLETGPHGLDSPAWIGMHDQGVESEFQWSDGSAVQFTYWDGWQPDNWRDSEDCANVRNVNDGRWNDQSCYNSLPYICKKPKEYISPHGIIATSTPKKLFVCESTSAVLSCPTSTVLSIKSATWGRTNTTRCFQVSVKPCKLNVTANLNAKCGGKNHCSLKATNSVLGADPCGGGIAKYLEIDYMCLKGPENSPLCKGGWHLSPDGSRCIRVIFDRKTWQDARSTCKTYGGDLVSFHSSAENILVTSLLVDSWNIGEVGGLWTGLTDAGQKGVYYWSDGSKLDYTNWLNTQPDERILEGSCVQATLQPGRMSYLFWQDVDCNSTLYFACAKPPNRQVLPTNLVPSGQSLTRTATPTSTVFNYLCPSGWMTNGSFCYKLMSQSKTWTDARDTCRSFTANSDLVSIHSVAENEFVASLFSGLLYAAWIGLSDRGVLYGYVWSDETPVQFTKWNVQQPDSHQGQQPCVEMYSTGEWGDTGCYSVKQFICKMPRSNNKPSATVTPTTPVHQTSGICPNNTILWNTMCYYFANDSQSSRLTWRAARQACQKELGGDLVSILSAAENNFIKSQISGHSSNALWIGLNDLGTESSYQWSDGSPVVYTNYGWKEPNDYYGQEDCLEIVKPGYWNDHHCSVLRSYICKTTNNSRIQALTTSPPDQSRPGRSHGRCKDGWVNYDKRCYRIVSDPQLSWENARDVCRKGLNANVNGDLVTVNDQYEQAFLTTMLLGKNDNFWIGFNDKHVEGSFFWTDNSPRKYTNWNVNEPTGYGWNKDCVDMTSSGEAGRWGTAQCDQKKGFICETGADQISANAPPGNTSCPPGYLPFGSDCFNVSYVPMSWKEALKFCQDRMNGSDLMSVHNSFEQAFVVMNLKDFQGRFWLGLSREANSKDFQWSDLSMKTYTNWAAKQPDAPYGQKTCVVASNSDANAGGWSDVNCSEKNGFICRLRRGEPHVSPPLLGSCPTGWEKFDKHCYLFRDSDLQPWAAARFKCLNQGGNLVSITSEQEQDFITFHYRRISAGKIWIGLNDWSLERGFTWSDGSPVTYLNWLPGEPNDKTGMENCIEMWPPSRGWNDQSCADRRGYICKQPLECSAALGMSIGAISKSQITASSMLASYGPDMARLNSMSAWCAKAQSGQYIQIDLLTETRLNKIALQGFTLNGIPSFIRTFTLQTSEDGVNYETYQRNGRDVVFPANHDANSVVTKSVKPTVNTRLIRIVPSSWTGSLCMRMELYGCPIACQTPLGMQSGSLNDTSLSASSTKDSSHKAANARPFRAVGWCAKILDKHPWYQITFPGWERKITKITTWGGGRGSGFVSVYSLKSTRTLDVDITVWSDYQEGGKTRNFRGNQDAVNPVSHLLAEPIIADALRIKPLAWSSIGACLRLEVFGCDKGCNSALGLRQGIIKDSALSASSSLDEAHLANKGRLNGSTGWCASDNYRESYFEVDFGVAMKVSTLAIQGAEDGKGYIKSYIVNTKDYVDGPWTQYRQNDKTKVFLANVDFSSIVKNSFPSGLRGRYIRIRPKTWSDRPCLRLELYGCKSDLQPTIIPSVSTTPSAVLTYRGSVKFSNKTWTDDLQNSDSKAFKTLARKIEKSIADLYNDDKNDEASKAFLNVTITGFSRGSIIAKFKLTFFRDIANNLGANVTKKLVEAVDSGELAGLAVDQSSLIIKIEDDSSVSTSSQPTTENQIDSEKGTRVINILIPAFLFLLMCCCGLGLYLFCKRKKGNHPLNHQQFNNPIFFSNSKQEVQTNGHAVTSNGTTTTAT